MVVKGECQVLISKNNLKIDIVREITGLLASLHSYGFSKPIVSDEDWSTSLTFMLTDIALEIELDWRDFDVFVLVVRLESGKLPNGYYVSEGRPCRYHLQKVISDRGWSVDQAALAMVSPIKNGKQTNIVRSKDDLVNRFCVYKKILDECIVDLVDEKDKIFSYEIAANKKKE